MEARIKAQCVEWFIETKSDVVVQRRFRTRYNRNPPSRPTIRAWYYKFMNTGSLNHKRGNGRPRVSDEDVRRVQQSFVNDPKKSTRSAARELNIKHSTVHKILKSLKFRSYKLQILQKITPNDWILRKEFAVTVLDRLAEDENYLRRIFFSDEATFHLSGKVNKQNVRIWGTENPHCYQEHTRDSEKINVWCGLFHDRVIGPFFFQENNINGNIYIDMLENFAFPQLEELQPNVIFQQDGAPPHWKRFVRDCLDQKFPNRWIGRGGPTPWPPRSPDITPCDFFVWGFVKDRVYASKVDNKEELRERIRRAFDEIDHSILRRVWSELECRLDFLRANNGKHIEVR
jgi:transposase